LERAIVSNKELNPILADLRLEDGHPSLLTDLKSLFYFSGGMSGHGKVAKGRERPTGAQKLGS
jgi:hypothetical protein